MISHAPKDYICPICLGVKKIESEETMLHPDDLVYQDDLTSVFINSFFIDGNEGHLIVVPNDHIENIYDISSKHSHAVMDTAQKMAVAVKEAYGCDGITLRLNNEPAGEQHAFHLHMHIFPRFYGDNFNENSTKKRTTTLKERKEYIQKIKKSLK